jgi:hypothetical protein
MFDFQYFIKYFDAAILNHKFIDLKNTSICLVILSSVFCKINLINLVIFLQI